MPQATRRWISEKVESLSKSLSNSNALPFSDILDAEMVNAAVLAAAGVTFNAEIRGRKVGDIFPDGSSFFPVISGFPSALCHLNIL